MASLAILAAAVGVLHATAIDELLGRRRLVNLACHHPERFVFGWERAESPFPGRVHLVNVWFRGRGRHDEWWFRMREATFTFSIFELPARRFHVESLRGDGFVFWRRLRRTPDEARPALASVLPPVPGFAAVPRTDEPPWVAPSPGKKYWTVTIDRVALTRVTDLWMDRVRFEGEARAEGRFSLLPHERSAVGPATLQVHSGGVTVDRRSIADSVEGRIATDIRPFDPSAVAKRPLSIWDYVSGSARIHAGARDLAGIASLLPESLRLSGTNGALRTRFTVAHGGSVRGNVELDVARLSCALPHVWVSARTVLRATVHDYGLETRRLDARSVRFELQDAEVRGPESSAGWWARLTAPAIEVRPGDGIRGGAMLACRDALPIVGAVSSKTPSFLRKLLEMPGLVAKARVHAGPRGFSVEGLDAEGSGARVSGRYESRGPAKEGALLVQKGNVAVAIRFEKDGAKLKVIGARKWFANAVAER